MTKTLSFLISSSNSLKIKSSFSGATILGVPIFTLGGDGMGINDNIYNIIPEIHKVLSSTSYTGRTMKNENDVLLRKNNIRDLGYTGRGDRQSNRKSFSTITLPKLVDVIQNKTFDEIKDDYDGLQGDGIRKIIILPNIIDISTGSEILLGLKLSGHTNTLTGTSN